MLYRWRQHLDDADSYWITGQEAADVLGVNLSRVRVLAAKDRIPYVLQVDGTRMHQR